MTLDVALYSPACWNRVGLVTLTPMEKVRPLAVLLVSLPVRKLFFPEVRVDPSVTATGGVTKSTSGGLPLCVRVTGCDTASLYLVPVLHLTVTLVESLVKKFDWVQYNVPMLTSLAWLRLQALPTL